MSIKLFERPAELAPTTATSRLSRDSGQPAAILVLLVAVLLLPGGLASAALASTLTIEGTVTGEDDGLPVTSYQVLAYDAQSQFLSSTITAADGTYQITGLPAGSVWLRAKNLARSDLHMDETHTGALCPFGECSKPAAVDMIQLVDGGPPVTVDFAVALGGNIAGVVSHEDTGSMLTNSYVTLYFDNGVRADSERVFSGGYRFFAFPPGIYHASTRGPLPNGNYIPEVYDDIVCYENGCDEGAATEILVVSGQTTTVDFALRPGGSISGVFVTDENTPVPGTPIAGQVALFDAQGTFLRNTHATDGTYLLDDLETGTYFLRGTNSSGYFNEIYEDVLWGHGHSAAVTDGTPVHVVAGQATTNIDFRLPSGGSISGRVTDALTGEPLSHLQIFASRQDDEQAPVSTWQAPGESAAGEKSSGAAPSKGLDGTYQLIPLDAGTYRVSVQTHDDSYFRAEHPELITLEVNDAVTGIDFALYPSAKVSGRVTDGAGQPIAGAIASWLTLDPDHTGFGNAPVAADGTYTLTGLPPRDDFFVIASAPGHVPLMHPNLVCHGINCDFDAATIIELDYGETVSGIDFELYEAARLEIAVTEVGSALPIRNVGLRVFDSTGLFVTSRGTDASGFALIDTLPAGDQYYVAAGFVPFGYYFELWQNRPFSYITDFTVPVPEVLTGEAIDFRGGVGTVQIAMDLDTADTAPQLSAEVVTELDGGGLLTTTEGFLHCDESGTLLCRTRAFPTGSTAVLVAEPDPGSTFEGFGGDADCLDGEVTLTGDVLCTATFMGEPPLFADGFESGGFNTWSIVLP